MPGNFARNAPARIAAVSRAVHNPVQQPQTDLFGQAGVAHEGLHGRMKTTNGVFFGFCGALGDGGR